MAPPIRVSTHQARLLHLAAQGLLARPRRRARRTDVLAAIARMRVLQIDTINVVARSPYLVLFSRLGAYRKEWLEEWLAEGAIFECWAHEASFVLAADYALHRRHSRDSRQGHWAMRIAARAKEHSASGMDALLSHIRERGAAKSSDFERGEGKSGGWWGWKDEKRWLEAWFALGELMVARRENFQRVYDLHERVLANARTNGHVWIEEEVSEPWMRREFTLGAVRALGVTQARWINDYFRSGRKLKDADLDAFVDAGELLRVQVEGWKHPAYVHPDHGEPLASAVAGRLRATQTTLLSPFDPVVWDRERAAAMFGFDYRIECYTPEARRKYGYYVLPILHRGRLVGRLDAKAHRTSGVFEIKALYLQEGIDANAALAAALAYAIQCCADWHATPRVKLGRCESKAFKRELQEAIRQGRPP